MVSPAHLKHDSRLDVLGCVVKVRHCLVKPHNLVVVFSIPSPLGVTECVVVVAVQLCGQDISVTFDSCGTKGPT